jgi:hypothetical protein
MKIEFFIAASPPKVAKPGRRFSWRLTMSLGHGADPPLEFYQTGAWEPNGPDCFSAHLAVSPLKDGDITNATLPDGFLVD